MGSYISECLVECFPVFNFISWFIHDSWFVMCSAMLWTINVNASNIHESWMVLHEHPRTMENFKEHTWIICDFSWIQVFWNCNWVQGSLVTDFNARKNETSWIESDYASSIFISYPSRIAIECFTYCADMKKAANILQSDRFRQYWRFGECQDR